MASSPHSAHLRTFNNVLSEGIQTYSSDMKDVALNHEYIPVSGTHVPDTQAPTLHPVHWQTMYRL